ncbi:MAG: hypothetical protein COV44_02860 [Deltaproteobacteria bacterium CG11_big_fil_rev_8_21_14_0_20_45_16]|nr:MAG: hypothetical protein COV44_02860 [Deltaproteobacteria bacterium CG11_big_fil_rev_8_21_14_0_20_45_16]
MFRRRYNELRGKPTLLAAVIQKFSLVAGLGFLTILGFVALVRYQLEPAFYADTYEDLHASFVSKESSLVTALLQKDIEKAKLVISDNKFLPNARVKEVIMRVSPNSPDLSCGSEIEKLGWGSFCHESNSLKGRIPIRSADQLLGWLMIEQREALTDWLPYSRIIQAIWVASIFLLILTFLFIIKFLRSTIIPLRKSIESLEGVESASDFESVFKYLPFKELVGLASRLSIRSRELADTKSALAEAKRKAHFSHVATQVAHDLQSPVAALKQISENLERIKKEDAIRSIRTSARRIDQISKDILSHFEVIDAHSKSSITFVAPVVESIVGEISLAHSDVEEIKTDIPSSLMAAVTTISESNLARSLSNLINNAIDAVERKGSGQVFVKLSEDGENILLSVEDTGLGMKEEDLHKVRTTGGTLHEGGHGLGLSFVKSVVSEVGGHLQIESSWQEGTTITLFLPKTRTPSWLIEKVLIAPESKIVVIDDDPSILDFWKRKLKSRNAEFFDHVPDQIKGDLVIIDQEIHGSKETGLDVISRLEHKDRAILSTSFFFSPEIQKRVEELRCHLLPKFLIDHFQIEFARKQEVDQRVDVVLIDDDPMCRDSWTLMAQVNKKQFRAYASYEEFCGDTVAKNVPIYVDKNLSNDISGYTVLSWLCERGYTKLHLTTGEYRTEPRPPGHISSVVSKEFPYLWHRAGP